MAKPAEAQQTALMADLAKVNPEFAAPRPSLAHASPAGPSLHLPADAVQRHAQMFCRIWSSLPRATGLENLRRGPADDSTRTVTVTRTDNDGSVTESVEAFTAGDRRIVDEETNSYLADAGVEKRPGGLRSLD